MRPAVLHAVLVLMACVVAGCSDDAPPDASPAEIPETSEERLARGTSLLEAKQLDEAIAALRPFMEPNQTGEVAARGLCRLAVALFRAGETAAAAEAAMRAEKLGIPDGEVDPRQILRQAEQVLSVQARIAEVTQDPGRVTDPKEARDLATVAYSRKAYLSAATLMERAFALGMRPDEVPGMRLLAARSAARVAADTDADGSTRLRWAQASHDWMRDEFQALRAAFSAGRVHARRAQALLASWQGNPDLELLKEGSATWPELGDELRRAWTTLRSDMAAFVDEIR